MFQSLLVIFEKCRLLVRCLPQLSKCRQRSVHVSPLDVLSFAKEVCFESHFCLMTILRRLVQDIFLFSQYVVCFLPLLAAVSLCQLALDSPQSFIPIMLQECNQTDQREIGVVLVAPERYNFDFTYSFNNYFNSNPTFVRKKWICGLSTLLSNSVFCY